MILFLLDMPGKGSWNGKWSGEGRCYARVKYDSQVPKDRIDRSYRYRWDDGWEARIDVSKITAAEANKYRKKSVGFAGYDWMIDSIIQYDKIMTDKDRIFESGTADQKYNYDIYYSLGGDKEGDFEQIHDIWLSLKNSNLEKGLSKGYINENDELYDGGPTVADIIKLMTKYPDAAYRLVAHTDNQKIVYDYLRRISYNESPLTQEEKDDINNIFRNIEQSSFSNTKDAQIIWFK